jgi:hypothetical protein
MPEPTNVYGCVTAAQEATAAAIGGVAAPRAFERMVSDALRPAGPAQCDHDKDERCWFCVGDDDLVLRADGSVAAADRPGSADPRKD